MATLTIQALTTFSLVATYTALNATCDQFLNNGHTFLVIKNSVAGTNCLTIASQVSPVPKGLVAINVTVDVTANAEKHIGFFDGNAYNDSSGYCQMTYTTHTGLTIAAISVT